MRWLEKTPKSGDIIRTKVSFYYHYGIFISEAEVIQFGLPDDPGRPSEDIEVLASDIDAFLMGGELETGCPEKDEAKKMRPREEIIKIARSKLGEKGYDLLHNNCEHFVNLCAFGESKSNFLDDVRKRIRNRLGKT